MQKHTRDANYSKVMAPQTSKPAEWKSESAGYQWNVFCVLRVRNRTVILSYWFWKEPLYKKTAFSVHRHRGEISTYLSFLKHTKNGDLKGACVNENGSFYNFPQQASVEVSFWDWLKNRSVRTSGVQFRCKGVGCCTAKSASRLDVYRSFLDGRTAISSMCLPSCEFH